MKHFLILYHHQNENILTNDLLLSHIEFLKKISKEHILKSCGPFQDSSGAVLIFECESEVDANRIVESDPFISTKYYQSFEIREFVNANEENHFLMSAT